MAFSFATCDRKRALTFLQKLYPSYSIEDTLESAGPLLEFVERDVVRITDPDFHTGQVVQSKNWDDDCYDELKAAVDQLTAGGVDAGLVNNPIG